MEHCLPRPSDCFSTPTKSTNFNNDDGLSVSTQKSTSDFNMDKENDSEWQPDFLSKPDRFSDGRPSGGGSYKKARAPTDRFIPVRKTGIHTFGVDTECNRQAGSSSKKGDDESNNKEAAENLMGSVLKAQMLGVTSSFSTSPTKFSNQNLFKYSSPTKSFDPMDIVDTYEKTQAAASASKSKTENRRVPKVPFKVLDAPALQDDFYLNLLDWSNNNLLSVGLASCVYLWSGSNSRVFKLCDLGPDDMVTSINWEKRGNLLGVGTNSGEVHIWDINKVKKVRTMEGHTSRVGSLAWGDTCLISGSRDKSILLRDIRSTENYHDRFLSHTQEVCGLKWSYDNQMFSSGGNDNKMFIWTAKSSTPIFKTSAHKAAVKALAWSPHQHGLLATGGGTADKCIRFWNAHKGKLMSTVDTGSQVCNLLFSKNVNELISTHGYTENQIHLWSYPSMKKVSTLTGHTFRVLYLAMSPDGRSIVTGAGDETLRFWDLFPKAEETQKDPQQSELNMLQKISIR